MIDINFTGMCKCCGHADLELDCMEYERFNGIRKDWTVRCIHANACDAMEERVTEKYADYVEYVCGKKKDGDTK